LQLLLHVVVLHWLLLLQDHWRHWLPLLLLLGGWQCQVSLLSDLQHQLILLLPCCLHEWHQDLLLLWLCKDANRGHLQGRQQLCVVPYSYP
jgi:hypothetical protein